VLLSICRLERQKGVDLAVRAFAALRERHLDLELVVLGEGAERSALAALARELGVHVHLLGRIADVAAWLRRATMLVHPVRWEGFGLAVLEAMFAGLPVVASRVSSLPELVVDGETGILVAPDDADALAAGIDRVLERPARLGAAGRQRAVAQFSTARMADATFALYQEVLAEKAARTTHHPPPTH
jgi:glycosyltransferase involved in cell wall biosynthesis